ncbi:hypothetical protein JKF63_00896 [Porcisia hertigi]|uniref:Uncharacterized protein n=1 Tax=Porcisia hertigi TaxID=2761500 RepID=A0A836KXL2_9TRYP|nr:hypothetical protein JKF63_00896 [Porcisia hertigi]
MSTLAVCSYCGSGMRFDDMKTHLNSCGENSTVTGFQKSSAAKGPMQAATGGPISGVEFYKERNSLSRLSSRSCNPGENGGYRLSASPLSENEAATQQPVTDPSPGGIDAVPSPFPTPLSPRDFSSVQPQRQSSSLAAHSSVYGGAASPPAAPLPSPPLIHLSLRGASREPNVSSRGAVSHIRPASLVPSNRGFPLADSLTASSTALVRGTSNKSQHATMDSAGAASGSRYKASQIDASSGVGETEPLNHHPTSSVPRAPPSACRGTLCRTPTVADDSPLPSTIADLSSAHSSAPLLMSAKNARDPPMAAMLATAGVSSARPLRRPGPQLSSFAIRLRGNQGFLSPTLSAADSGSRGPSRQLHTSEDVGDSQQANGTNDGRSSPRSASTVVEQMKASLSQMQRLVCQQQQQYSSLLQAHGDLHRQVTAQRDAHNDMVRHSREHAAAMKDAIQSYAAQGRREQAAVRESVDSLWAVVSHLQQCLRNDSSPQAKALARSNLAEESAYYSDIASFIQPDIATTLSVSASLPIQKESTRHPEKVLSSFLSNSLMHPSAPLSACASSFVSNAAAPSLKGVRSSSYVMDVQQQQQQQHHHRESLENRVIAMLHAKPSVVIRRSPWR